MVDEKVLMKILNSREERARKQKELLDTYNSTLISFTLNIPGREKDNDLYRKIHKKGFQEIIEEVSKRDIELVYKEEIDKSTGREAYILVDMEPLKLKDITINIEESHPLGRIFDIDVFDRQGKQISRSDLKAEPRKCLLCNKEVRLCMRERNHSYEELILAIRELGQKHLKR